MVREYLFEQTLDEYMETVARAPTDRSSHDDGHCEMSWDFNAGWAGALKMAEDGWEEGRGSIYKASETIFDILDPENPMMGVDRDVVGHTVDVGRFVSGDPECMITTAPGVGRAPLKVVAVCGALGNVDAQRMAHRGAATVALVDYLETLQYRVELWAAYHNEHGGNKAAVAVCVKEADQPVDLDRLGFFIAHPAAMRRINFAWREAQDQQYREDMGIDRGYGRTSSFAGKHNEDLFLPANNFSNLAQATEWVRKTLSEAGFLKEECSV